MPRHNQRVIFNNAAFPIIPSPTLRGVKSLTALNTSYTIDVQHLQLRLLDMHTPSIQPNIPFQASKSCGTCSKIAQEVGDWAGFVQRNWSVSIARWATFLDENGCLTCEKIVAYFESHGSEKAPQPQCTMRVACDRGGDLSLSCVDEICLEKYCIQEGCSTFCSTSKSEGEKVCLRLRYSCWSTIVAVLRHS